MKTKEKLERAGYAYMLTWHGCDYYRKGNNVILIDIKTGDAIAYYERNVGQMTLITNEILEELLCQ